MDKATWQERIRERLGATAKLLGEMTPGMTYGALSAATVLPLATAVQQGEFAAIGALFGMVGSVGGNLIANQLQKWHDRSEAELAQELSGLAETQPEWREALDALILELETPRMVQAILGEAEWDRFERLLRQELARLGNLASYQVHLTEIHTEGGAVFQQDAHVGGDFVNRDKITHIYQVYQAAPGQAQMDEGAFIQAVNRYLAWVQSRYGQLNLRGIERRERRALSLTLDDVYVSLQASVTLERRQTRRGGREALARELMESGEPAKSIDMAQLLALGSRLAIIGGPGSGKTTFLQIIAATLAQAMLTGDTGAVARHLGLTGDLPLPIFVSLSDYNRYRRRCDDAHDPRQGTLTAFISHSLIRQEAALSLPSDFFERLLLHGKRCIVLLDGLDEVADERERALVRRAVENLAANQGIHHLLVTSRTRAYRDRTVLTEEFQVAEVQPMSLAQAQALASRWCWAVYDETRAAAQSARLQEAIAKLERQREQRGERRLVDSPLMVTIVAIVHYNDRRLPDERADLYNRCVDVLLAESYKSESEAIFDLVEWGGSEREKRSLLTHLAFCMMSAGEAQGRTVEEAQLRRWLRPQLAKQWGEGQADAQLAGFIQAMRERGSLLDERDGRYQFVHLTFQEFLCAAYLVDTVRERAAIVKLLFEEGRVAHSWWRETVLLTVGYLGLGSIDAPLTLVQALASQDVEPRLALGATEVAAVAFLEQNGRDTETQSLLTRRLATLLTDRRQVGEMTLRAAAGVTLGRLGDPRPGVGVLVRKGVRLPDIDWVPIEAGPFIMGSDRQKDARAFQYEFPQFTCTLITQPYRMGRYPITVAQYACFVDGGGYRERDFWTDAGWDWVQREGIEGPDVYRDIFQTPNHPQVGVSWYEAMAFCRWLSEALGQTVTLPSEAQWERAARFTDGRIYPWNSDFAPERCNMGKTGIQATSAVGLFPSGVSQEGVLDMSGNVWEWTRSLWGKDLSKPEFSYPYDPNDGREDMRAGNDVLRVVRGGSWLNDEFNVRCAVRRRGSSVDRNDLVGFRVMSPGL